MAELPVFYPCPSCQSAGQIWDSICRRCAGSGMVERLQPIRLSLPPGVEDGAIFRLPLRGLGLHNLYLRASVAVREKKYRRAP